jgi:uncharacterized protein (DUF1697 family)
VNVGGRNKVNMKEFVQFMHAGEFIDAKSYLNSGNIAFKSDMAIDEINTKIREILDLNYSAAIGFIIKSREEIGAILNANPYSAAEDDNSKRIVALLSRKIDAEELTPIQKDPKITEKYYLRGDALYIYYAEGAGESKFTNSYIEKKLKLSASSRNWNTLEKALEGMEVEGKY